jgi:hypothetical protein
MATTDVNPIVRKGSGYGGKLKRYAIFNVRIQKIPPSPQHSEQFMDKLYESVSGPVGSLN